MRRITRQRLRAYRNKGPTPLERRAAKESLERRREKNGRTKRAQVGSRVRLSDNARVVFGYIKTGYLQSRQDLVCTIHELSVKEVEQALDELIQLKRVEVSEWKFPKLFEDPTDETIFVYHAIA